MTTSSTVITNVRVFNGEGLTDLQSVAIADGRISDNTSADTTVDGKGGTLLPGLIDAHIHLDSIENLKDAAHWGITTMLDMGSYPTLTNSLRNHPGLTDIRSAGYSASAPGGTQTTIMGFPAFTALSKPEEAEKFVADRVAEGSDYIKVIVENPNIMGTAALSAPIIAALVKAAHTRNLLVFAHATNTVAFRLAADAGVDVITHVPIDAPIDEALVKEIVAAGEVSVPTLVMMRGVASVSALRTHAGTTTDYHNAEVTVAALHRAGVPIFAGTDANNAPGAPFQVKHGESLHEELSLLVAAGLMPLEVLRGATILPAKHFGLRDRGAIQPGLRADLVLIEGDPTTDITVTRAIQGVWIKGERVR